VKVRKIHLQVRDDSFEALLMVVHDLHKLRARPPNSPPTFGLWQPTPQSMRHAECGHMAANLQIFSPIRGVLGVSKHAVERVGSWHRLRIVAVDRPATLPSVSDDTIRCGTLPRIVSSDLSQNFL